MYQLYTAKHKKSVAVFLYHIKSIFTVKALCLISSIVTGITVTAVNGILNYTKYAEHYKETNIGYFIAVLAVTFVSATVVTFAFIQFVCYLNIKKQTKIEKRLEEDE